ncbi:hypothetical protein C8A05DRAFT_31449, partial [Staphylotrichum tortipilum]
MAPNNQLACVSCKRLKRRCNKGIPCDMCQKNKYECRYRDPSDNDGLCDVLSTAKDIHSTAFSTLLEVMDTRKDVMAAVNAYFGRTGSWFHVVERDSLERRLDAEWENLPAQVSIIVLCMILLDNSFSPPGEKGITDAVYHSAKFLVGLAQVLLPISTETLQTQLLLAQYEFAQGLPDQAFSSLGTCITMARTLGWLDDGYWDALETSKWREYQRYSILWYTVVHLDNLLYIGYLRERHYPQRAETRFDPNTLVTRPERLDPRRASIFQLPFGGKALTCSNGELVFPETCSAHDLAFALATPHGQLPHEFVNLTMELLHHDAFPLGTDLLVPRESWEGDPLQTNGTLFTTEMLETVESQPEDSVGNLAPCWAVALRLAASLSFWVLKRSDLFSRSSEALKKLATRWKIAEREFEKLAPLWS